MYLTRPPTPCDYYSDEDTCNDDMMTDHPLYNMGTPRRSQDECSQPRDANLELTLSRHHTILKDAFIHTHQQVKVMHHVPAEAGATAWMLTINYHITPQRVRTTSLLLHFIEVPIMKVPQVQQAVILVKIS